MAELEPPVVPDRPFFRWVQQNKVRPNAPRAAGYSPVERQVDERLRCRPVFLSRITNGSVSTRAAAISFRLFVAFFPAMILLLSIIPYTPLRPKKS